jgi:uncharacterized protein YbcC (UPF0753/DUF2309 family)
MVIFIILLIVCWLFTALIIYLATRCIQESGAMDPFLPTQQNESEKKDTKLKETKLLEAGTDTEENLDHV